MLPSELLLSARNEAGNFIFNDPTSGVKQAHSHGKTSREVMIPFWRKANSAITLYKYRSSSQGGEMQGPKPKSPTRKGILDRDEAS
jgi:hypothetical protein